MPARRITKTRRRSSSPSMENATDSRRFDGVSNDTSTLAPSSNVGEEKTDSESFDSTVLPTIVNCRGNNRVCGKEAACRTFDNDTAICVCPHDSSTPTADLKCPNRMTVSITPRPIHNIILLHGQGTNNATSTTTEFSRTYLPDDITNPRPIPIILGGTAVVLCVAIVACFLTRYYCLRRRAFASKCNDRASPNPSPMSLKMGLLLANQYTPNSQYSAYASPEVPILRRDSIAFLRNIGEGCFGKVYKGELRRGGGTETVAVKVLKDSASREAEEDFMREVDIMSAFRHRNILFLIGVVQRDSGNGPWMVFEYMPHGDLAELLRANSRQLRSPTPGLPPLNKESLLWISTQIASGMAYLSAQRFVHRDLACRNCLVGSGLIVKIADFGMSRDVYTCDYYKIGGSRLLPVRWMAPESVVYGRFTLESDVWSFGVVLWEVYSFGKQPYYGHNNDQVVNLILQGIMLIPPEDCPSFICEVMRGCWKTDPKDRLRFTDVVEKLEIARDKCGEKGSLPRPPRGPAITISNTITRNVVDGLDHSSSEGLDTDGYLLPATAPWREYLQPLPPLSNRPLDSFS